ncbi:putative alkaline phosphatase [Streptomyces sp. NBRC 110611]|uniref:alkaline phosphatase D family protein n=1 Tax=Streptomyces sp. NBRC 110611 TaxID=1621259 RepID=UPI00082D46F4|nr:alkaline phosphatase D family protein [Streptomyces sp. NBRC 110611]GAU69415.1 putative alkaline phosphatase [Streptomyces sp. NBRC 110611]
MTHPAPYEQQIRAAAGHVGRRRFLTATGAAAALAFAVGVPATGVASVAEADPRKITENPFTLGVASGDPQPRSVVLWTRLAPRPYEPGWGSPRSNGVESGGGMPNARITVHWEVAHDERFTQMAGRGHVDAHPEFNHSVHIEPTGLAPDRVYYYRFRAGSWTSPVGRTRTAPAPSARPSALSLAAVSCQAYHDGYYTAYRYLAHEDLDIVFHLGDYLYEYPVDAAGGARNYTDRTLPARFNRETVTLEDYRLRYALYKSDPDLQAAHAAHPFLVTWDDHEVENNYASGVNEGNLPPAEFLVRRAAAYRAYWENQPLRRPQRPQGADARLYRRVHYGQLAQFDILDTRQYRSDQAYGDGWRVPGPECEDPRRTVTGAAQERWLIDGWRRSTARWNVLPQQVTFSERRNATGSGYQVSMDAWDGYTASRERVLAGAESAGVENLVVLTGDVHVHYGFDIKRDFKDPGSRTAGVEFVTTSITSGEDGVDKPANWATYMAANPHLKFYNGRRGYLTVTLDRDTARGDYRTVSAVTTPGAPITTAASFVSEAGEPGLKAA